MEPTSTPKSLFVVQTMLIRQLLFLGFYRLNAVVTCAVCEVEFCGKVAKPPQNGA
jgi:hypothetical protein